MPVEVLTQIVATISDPSAMLGPEVNKTYIAFYCLCVKIKNTKRDTAQPYLCL